MPKKAQEKAEFAEAKMLPAFARALLRMGEGADKRMRVLASCGC